MYIKWMVCDVKKDKRQKFSLAQETWKKTTEADGFIAQAGGWNLKNRTEACIISFWDSKELLENFMNDFHDNIFGENKQAEAYKSLVVSHFCSERDIDGKAASLTEALKIGKILRIADCYLKPERIVPFEEVKKEIWLPGMKKFEGMLGGIFSKSSNNDLRYLVSTFWDSPENHNNYVVNILPNYQEKASASTDVKKISGKIIMLVDSWKIIN